MYNQYFIHDEQKWFKQFEQAFGFTKILWQIGHLTKSRLVWVSDY